MYSGPGAYQITLDVTSDFGCMASLIKSLEVQPSPVANFRSNNVCIGLPTSFNDSSTISSGQLVSWYWNFLDGDSSIFVIFENGEVHCWGLNDRGQLGLGPEYTSWVPHPVTLN